MTQEEASRDNIACKCQGSQHVVSMSDRIPLATFIVRHEIKLTTESWPENPHMPEWRDADHWRCWLSARHSERRDRRSMLVYFSCGFGHKRTPPKVVDVLNCLASNDAESFEDWCDDMSYDPDSRKTYRIWKVVQKQACELKRVLGDDAYQTLLWGVDRKAKADSLDQPR